MLTALLGVSESRLLPTELLEKTLSASLTAALRRVPPTAAPDIVPAPAAAEVVAAALM